MKCPKYHLRIVSEEIEGHGGWKKVILTNPGGGLLDLVVLDQGIDTTTMYGRLQFNILAAIGEFERELIMERSMEGREKAITRGVKFGAKPKLTKKEIIELARDIESPIPLPLPRRRQPRPPSLSRRDQLTYFEPCIEH
jgi:hypothetical protein